MLNSFKTEIRRFRLLGITLYIRMFTFKLIFFLHTGLGHKYAWINKRWHYVKWCLLLSGISFTLYQLKGYHLVMREIPLVTPVFTPKSIIMYTNFKKFLLLSHWWVTLDKISGTTDSVMIYTAFFNWIHLF